MQWNKAPFLVLPLFLYQRKQSRSNFTEPVISWGCCYWSIWSVTSKSSFAFLVTSSWEINSQITECWRIMLVKVSVFVVHVFRCLSAWAHLEIIRASWFLTWSYFSFSRTVVNVFFWITISTVTEQDLPLKLQKEPIILIWAFCHENNVLMHNFILLSLSSSSKYLPSLPFLMTTDH